MCNCKTPTPCTPCLSGQSCNCPPDYAIIPLQAPCRCCPSGYTYSGPTPNYPNGICTSGGNTTSPIPCIDCEQSVSADCVFYDTDTPYPSNCFGFANGDSLTVMFQKICSTIGDVVVQQIANSTDLTSRLCDILKDCPENTNTIEIIRIDTVCCPTGQSFCPDVSATNGFGGYCGVQGCSALTSNPPFIC